MNKHITAILAAVVFLPFSTCAWAEASNHSTQSAADRAIESYQSYIRNNPDAANLATVKHRLADLHFKKATDALDAGQSSSFGLNQVIADYQHIIDTYPSYAQIDQIYYQGARAAELNGRNDLARQHLKKLIASHPNSSHYDEAQFRMAELYFAEEKFAKAANAYREVIKFGQGSKLYKEALFKHGWAYFKLGKYRQSLPSLLTLMDLESRRDIRGNLVVNDPEKVKEVMRIVSLDFYYMGGADTIKPFINQHGGSRLYEELIYDSLSDLYMQKDIPVEAAKTYLSYIKANKHGRDAPEKHEKAIAIYQKAGYLDDVIEQKEHYVVAYQPRSDYWRYFPASSNPVLAGKVKNTLKELISHYHLSWQEHKKNADLQNALKWYSYYLQLYDKEQEAPTINYQYASLLFEAQIYDAAYVQYEKTAYNYGRHDKAIDAGFAAVQSMDKYIDSIQDEDEQKEKKIASATVFMKFAYGFPQHPKASEVVKNSAQRLYEAEDYEQAASVCRIYLDRYASANIDEQRSMWALMAVSHHKAENYQQAEQAYNEVLGLTEPSHSQYKLALDQLAASIYAYAKKAEDEGNTDLAAKALLRIRQKAPYSEIAITAQYDAANIYIKAENNPRAIEVLENLRQSNPNNQYQKDIVRKLAVLYAKQEQYFLAAQEYLVIGRTDEKREVQRAATLKAAKYFEKADKEPESLVVYNEFIRRFPQPVEEAIEVMSDIAKVYKNQNNMTQHYAMLRKIIAADAGAGAARNNRTKYLAAVATIGIATPRREAYERVYLNLPLDASLAKKKQYFEATVKAYELANTYGVDAIVTQANYYVGNIYYDFSRALMNSERPLGLSDLEQEQYTVLLEDQAYPFEEKAIQLLEINTNRMWQQNMYDEWIKRSISLLAELLPYKYDKREKTLEYADFE